MALNGEVGVGGLSMEARKRFSQKAMSAMTSAVRFSHVSDVEPTNSIRLINLRSKGFDLTALHSPDREHWKLYCSNRRTDVFAPSSCTAR